MTTELSRARDLLALAVAMAEHERDPDADRWQAPVEARADELDGAVTAFLDAGEETAALRLVGAQLPVSGHRPGHARSRTGGARA